MVTSYYCGRYVYSRVVYCGLPATPPFPASPARHGQVALCPPPLPLPPPPTAAPLFLLRLFSDPRLDLRLRLDWRP